jgi:excinuclease ABC subunit A
MGDSAERAMHYGSGRCTVITEKSTERFSSDLTADGITFEEPSEHLFSFNNPIGACPRCEGFGKVTGIDEDLVVPDKSRSIYDDAVACWRGETMKLWKERLVNNSARFEFPLHTPFYDLSHEETRLLWTGNQYFNGLDDFFRFIESERYKVQYRVMLARYTGKTICPVCGGSRLRPEALYVMVGDDDNRLNIYEMTTMPVERLYDFFLNFRPDDHDRQKGERVLTEITNRLRYLINVGLGYLTLDRLSSTLSGGESQRINLSTSLGSSLVGSLYILDEPSIGLHPRDTHNLIRVLQELRNLGNTVIVVEHEEAIIRAADQIIDIGPQAGVEGGRVVFCGPLASLEQASESLTSDYLFGRKRIEPPKHIRLWNNYIEIRGARENNLKGIDVKIPLGVMTCVTGVSGSGKSSLIRAILYPALRRHLFDSGSKPGSFERLSGDLELIKSVEMVDQNPIGKSSRSNPVTYIKAYDEIRKLFSDQPYARHNAMSPSHFSFNIAGGRCEECQGEGFVKVSMQFMADVELKCESCGGKRFKDEVLEVRYEGRSIYDVLEMSIDEAVEFFGSHKGATNKRIVEKLSMLQDVGLGYVKLGQASSTLSGGESQRVKLASFLLKENSEQAVMFIFDEPTTGLHFHDINKLMAAFNALITKGHTVVVIEHNPEVIRCADHVIDLGPEGGEKGGYIVFEGTPAELKGCAESYTGQFLSCIGQEQAKK